MNKYRKLLTALVAAGVFLVSLALAACSSDDPAPGFNLIFSGSGYNPHTGQTIRVKVFKDPGGTKVAEDSVLEPTDGTFSFTFANVLEQGTAYNLDYFADSDVGPGSGTDGNGSCDSPPKDHAWRVPIPAVTGDVDQAEVHNTNFTDVCARFT